MTPTPSSFVGRGLGGASALTLIALLVMGGTRVLYGSMVSRATGPEVYGAVAVAIAVTMILSLMLPTGIASAITRYIPHMRGRGVEDDARATYGRLHRSGMVAALVLAGAAAMGSLEWGLGLPGAIEIAALTGLYAMYVTHKAALYAFDRVLTYVALEIVANAVMLAGIVGVLALHSDLYLAPLVAGYAVFVFGTSLMLRPARLTSGYMPKSPEKPSLLGYVVLASVGSLASAGFLQATQLFAAFLASLTAAAYFAASITLIAPLHLLPRSVALALFPFMAHAHGAGQREIVRDHADRGTRATLALLAPVVAAGQFLAKDVLILYGGTPFADGAAVMQVMLVAAFAGIVAVASVNALSSESTRQLRISVASAVAGAGTGIAVIVLAGPLLGDIGVAVAYLAGASVTAAGPVAVVWRRYAMTWAGPMLRAGSVIAVSFVGGRLVASLPGLDGAAPLLGATTAALAVVTSVVVLRQDLATLLTRTRGGPTNALAQRLARHAGDAGSPSGDLPGQL